MPEQADFAGNPVLCQSFTDIVCLGLLVDYGITMVAMSVIAMAAMSVMGILL